MSWSHLRVSGASEQGFRREGPEDFAMEGTGSSIALRGFGMEGMGSWSPSGWRGWSPGALQGARLGSWSPAEQCPQEGTADLVTRAGLGLHWPGPPCPGADKLQPTACPPPSPAQPSPGLQSRRVLLLFCIRNPGYFGGAEGTQHSSPSSGWLRGLSECRNAGPRGAGMSPHMAGGDSSEFKINARLKLDHRRGGGC